MLTCNDGLIWIGASYASILCRSQKTCARPFRKNPPHCYVHEAEWRGCCRKIPQIPPWLSAGQSRIFLAHRGGLKGKHRGKIFGYFIFHRFEKITLLSTPTELPLQESHQVEDYRGKRIVAKCWNGDEIVTHLFKDNKWHPTGRQCPHPPENECREGEVKKKRCPDDTEITTHKCINGRWDPTNEECPPVHFGDKECRDDDTRIRICPNGDIITTLICIDGKWKPTGTACPRPLPPDQTMFETERSCSLRLKPGSIYIVDALAAAISDKFGEELDRLQLFQKHNRTTGREGKDKILKKGHNLFKQVIKTLHDEQQPKTKFPKKLTDKAEIRGELVLFYHPPKFEKFPKVDMRSLERIDGDSIIDQVAEGKSQITIQYCGESLIDQIANSLQVSKSLANDFVEQLRHDIAEDLKLNGTTRIPNFGSFTVKTRKSRVGRNPRTGEKMQIPAKDYIAFRSFKKLKEDTGIVSPPGKSKGKAKKENS